jgi:hypothetical protein
MKQLYIEKLYKLWYLTNIIRLTLIKLIKIETHVARMVHMRNACTILVGNLKERVHLRDLGVDGTKMLKYILMK